MDQLLTKLVDECRRQEQSCLYTSTTLYEWLKSLRFWRIVFIVTPIVLSALGSWPLLKREPGFEWLTGLCILLAGVIPAIYKALKLDVSLEMITANAHHYKSLQDNFRQAANITAFSAPATLEKTLQDLMQRMDDVRSLSLTPPERFFEKAQRKIQAGHYDFDIDLGHYADPTNKPLETQQPRSL